MLALKALFFFLAIFTITPIVFLSLIHFLGRFFGLSIASDSIYNQILKKITREK